MIYKAPLQNCIPYKTVGIFLRNLLLYSLSINFLKINMLTLVHYLEKNKKWQDLDKKLNMLLKKFIY